MGPSEEGNINPLQYSCLENPIDTGSWWATVPEDIKSQTPQYIHGDGRGVSQASPKTPISIYFVSKFIEHVSLFTLGWEPFQHWSQLWFVTPPTLSHHPTTQCAQWFADCRPACLNQKGHFSAKSQMWTFLISMKVSSFLLHPKSPNYQKFSPWWAHYDNCADRLHI